MDLSVNQRLVSFQEQENFSWEKLRIQLGVRRKQQVSNWKNLNEKIPDKFIIKLIEIFPNLNARWLITGEGEINENNNQVNERSEVYLKRCPICNEKDEIIIQLKERIKDKEELLKVYRNKKESISKTGT